MHHSQTELSIPSPTFNRTRHPAEQESVLLVTARSILSFLVVLVCAGKAQTRTTRNLSIVRLEVTNSTEVQRKSQLSDRLLMTVASENFPSWSFTFGLHLFACADPFRITRQSPLRYRLSKLHSRFTPLRFQPPTPVTHYGLVPLGCPTPEAHSGFTTYVSQSLPTQHG